MNKLHVINVQFNILLLLFLCTFLFLWTWSYFCRYDVSVLSKAISSGPSIAVGTDVLPLENLAGDFLELMWYKSFPFDSGLNYFCISALCRFKKLSCNYCGQFWIQPESYYNVPCGRCCSSDYGELWLQRILEWTKADYLVFANIFLGYKTVSVRIHPDIDDSSSGGSKNAKRESSVM